MRNRLLSVTFIAAIAAGSTILACGGGGGGGGMQDAKVFKDSKVFLDGQAVTGLGMACTGTGQGNCPTGLVCLGLQGGTGTWCSKTCTQGSGDTCESGYTGPGVAACILAVSSGSGGSATDYCGIICADSTGTCPSTTCNDTCPSPLLCKATLQNGSGSAVGSACE